MSLFPGAQRGRCAVINVASTLPPASCRGPEGGRATDATVSPFVGNGNFEYINGNGADKSRTESWEKLKASGALDGPALGLRGGTDCALFFCKICSIDQNNEWYAEYYSHRRLPCRLESAPFSAPPCSHEGATLHGANERGTTTTL